MLISPIVISLNSHAETPSQFNPFTLFVNSISALLQSPQNAVQPLLLSHPSIKIVLPIHEKHSKILTSPVTLILASVHPSIPEHDTLLPLPVKPLIINVPSLHTFEPLQENESTVPDTSTFALRHPICCYRSQWENGRTQTKLTSS